MTLELQRQLTRDITAKKATSPFAINPQLCQAGEKVFEVAIGERRSGIHRKINLLDELNKLSASAFTLNDEDKMRGEKTFKEKLFEFRLRMVGAISLYSFFADQPYKQLVTQDGMDSFYLFWYLGAAQDDKIDRIPKSTGKDKETVSDEIHNAIFGPNNQFEKAAHTLLKQKIDISNVENAEKGYLQGKVNGWYQFIVRQEAEVIRTPLSEFGFESSRRYREDQNRTAGAVLVAILNWGRCLDPRFQRLETVIPKFSFLTQIIDDIADTIEDLASGRPSFSVGALIDNLEELERFREEVTKREIKKVHPRFFKSVAPGSFAQISQLFQQYTEELQKQASEYQKDAKGLVTLSKIIFKHFPTLRDFIHRIRPEAAVF